MKDKQNFHTSNIFSSGRSADNTVSIEINTTSKIDACVFSPNCKHIVTYSAGKGKIQIWEFDKEDGTIYLQSSCVYLEPREYKQNIDFALSTDGNKIFIYKPFFIYNFIIK